MGKVSTTAKADRKRPVSCHFCRSRKLRCDRQSPCTNCQTRGVQCTLYPTNSVELPGTRPNAQILAPNGSNAELTARLLRLEEIVLKHSDPVITHRAPPAHRPWQNSALTTFIPPTSEGLPSKIEADILKKVSFNEDWFVSSHSHTSPLVGLVNEPYTDRLIDVDISHQRLL
jgi:hypothetical protein